MQTYIYNNYRTATLLHRVIYQGDAFIHLQLREQGVGNHHDTDQKICTSG